MNGEVNDVGILLKQAREAKGISLDVVHEATKVPLDALKAIEEGYKVRTLSAFYYKSFVKIYALYLGLDAGAIIPLIPTHHPKPVLPVSIPRPGAQPATAAGPHRVEGVRSRSWDLWSHPVILKRKKKIFKTAVAAVAGICAVLAIVLIGHRVVTTRPQIPATAAKEVPLKPVARTEAKPVAKVEEPVKAVKPESSKTAVKDISVTARAQVSTWISVNVDGEEVFRGTLKKGTASGWKGHKKIELSAKDLGAIELEVNGRNIGKLARKDLKARKVIVTPEGLTVGK